MFSIAGIASSQTKDHQVQASHQQFSASKSTSKFNKSDERPSFGGDGPTAYNNASMVHYQSSAIGDTSDLLHDISIASPSVLAQNIV